MNLLMKMVFGMGIMVGFSGSFAQAQAPQPIRITALLEVSKDTVVLDGWQGRFGGISDLRLTLLKTVAQNKQVALEKGIVLNSVGIPGVLLGMGQKYEVLISLDAELEKMGGFHGYLSIVEQAVQQSLRASTPKEEPKLVITISDHKTQKVLLTDTSPSTVKTRR